MFISKSVRYPAGAPGRRYPRHRDSSYVYVISHYPAGPQSSICYIIHNVYARCGGGTRSIHEFGNLPPPPPSSVILPCRRLYPDEITIMTAAAIRAVAMIIIIIIIIICRIEIINAYKPLRRGCTCNVNFSLGFVSAHNVRFSLFPLPTPTPPPFLYRKSRGGLLENCGKKRKEKN